MDPVRQSRRVGFTLVELLTVVAVITVLVGILIPVIQGAKQRAKVSNDISQLRQLGAAASLYANQNDERFPAGCPELVDAKLVPTQLCGGMNDANPSGSVNLFLDSHGVEIPSYLGLKVPYKHSFLGFRELRFDAAKTASELKDATNTGWLVDLSEAKPSEPYGRTWEGRYRRLLYDTSVRTFNTSWSSGTYEGHASRTFAPITLFGDFENGWKPDSNP